MKIYEQSLNTNTNHETNMEFRVISETLRVPSATLRKLYGRGLVEFGSTYEYNRCFKQQVIKLYGPSEI